MKRRTTFALATGALLVATAAAIPVLDLDHPDARDLASWIEVDDPPSRLLEPVPTDEALVVPDLEPRTPPDPRSSLYDPCGGRVVVVVAMATSPAPGTTAADARDVAAWIEVDDPPVEILALPAVQEEITVPDPDVRRPPAPSPGTTGVRVGLPAWLTRVPAAPPAVDEPVTPALAGLGSGPGSVLVVPALAAVRPPAPAADRRVPDACCRSWQGPAC